MSDEIHCKKSSKKDRKRIGYKKLYYENFMKKHFVTCQKMNKKYVKKRKETSNKLWELRKKFKDVKKT